MAKSVFAMPLVNLQSVTSYADSISQLLISLSAKKGLKILIRCLSTMRTWMLTLSFSTVTVKYLGTKLNCNLIKEEDSSQCLKILSQYKV